MSANTREASPERTPGGEDSSPPGVPGAGSIAPAVFYPAAAVIFVFVLWATVFQDSSADVIAAAQAKVVGGVGWYYMAVVSLFVIFALWVGVGRYGDIKLGKDEEKAEFGLPSWLAMLFAAGMGIGLVFYGVAEPLGFFDGPQPGTGSSDAAKIDSAMAHTFLNWGIHPWAIYVVVGLAVAYSVHRKGRPVSIRWALEPIFGDKVKGRWGDAVDVVAIVGTLFGVATSLGFGVMQISAGLDFVGWAEDPGKTMQVALICGITAMATLSVVSGVGKGIKWLSNFNMSLAALLLLFVVVFGPTLFILNGFVSDIGIYLQNLLRMSFETGASQGPDGTSWVQGSTIFYWGWWISWAPFVGIFIARISRGRTVREFVCGVMLVPTLLTFFWFAALGGGGLHEQVFGGGGLIGDDGVVPESALFAFLDTLPAGPLVAGATILLIVTFFVTSSDSGSYVVDMLASGGDPNPPVWSRVFWALAEGAVAIALLVAGGQGTDSLTTLQTVAILIALPFSFVMLAMCVATLKAFAAERRAYLEAKREERVDRMIDRTIRRLEEDLESGAPGAARGSVPKQEQKREE